jgi:hypothetical protein
MSHNYNPWFAYIPFSKRKSNFFESPDSKHVYQIFYFSIVEVFLYIFELPNRYLLALMSKNFEFPSNFKKPKFLVLDSS